MRARVQREIDGEGIGRPPGAADKAAPDNSLLCHEVADFVDLARSGAYLGGDRRVSPTERTRWRFTFKRLVSELQKALRSADAVPASVALESLIDLACETVGYNHFRTDDAMAAAGVVVSDAVEQLWRTTRERDGFDVFSQRAAQQLIRWESPYGWTRHGGGPVAAKETTLADILTRTLRDGDIWERFAGHYLTALNEVATQRDADARTAALAQWHRLLVENLSPESGGLLEQIVEHPAVTGFEGTFVKAQLARKRGDDPAAGELIALCLQQRPGHPGFRQFATDLGCR